MNCLHDPRRLMFLSTAKHHVETTLPNGEVVMETRDIYLPHVGDISRFGNCNFNYYKSCWDDKEIKVIVADQIVAYGTRLQEEELTSLARELSWGDRTVKIVTLEGETILN